MRSQNHPIILFIDRNGFSVYQDVLTNIPKFNFTPDLVSNLDVVNKEQFVNLITTFIQINKIVPSSLAVILSDNVIYVKDLINPQKPISNQAASIEANADNERKDEIQNFLENIPFEEVLARVIKTDSLNRIAAANKDLVMTIADVFVNKGSAIEAVIPSFLYGPAVNFTSGLTQENIQIVLAGSEILKIGNLLTDQQQMRSSQSFELEQKNKEKKPKNFRQYILIGVFAALLVILAVVYLTLGSSKNTPIKKIKTFPSIVPTAPPVGGRTQVQESITAIPIDLKTINIKISHNASSSAIAVNLKSKLSGIGFQNIVDEVSEISIPEKSSIIFSQSIQVDLKDKIITEIKKILPDVSILENQDSNFTISILIGKS